MRVALTLLVLAVLAAAADPAQLAGRAESAWKAGQHQQADELFRAAVAAAPRDAGLKVRYGRFLLQRNYRGDAAQAFEQALAVDKDHPGALLGMALLAADQFDKQAVEFATRALVRDPKLLEAQELLGRLALEDGDYAGAAKAAAAAETISAASKGAVAIRAVIEWMQDREPRAPNAEAYALGGHILILNRRYTEGIALYRKALELDPRNWRARSQLGINLMRLGQSQEAREHLEKVYYANNSDEATRNTLRLLDSYKNFETRKSANTVVITHRKESELLAPIIESELKRAIATFEKKYQMKLPEPVQVELYPDHEDFAVRTLGIPGLGALGVTFGHVVAMDSPSGRKPGTFHWASTLWHELSHVFVLTATKHRVPRWFTEGMAVHEETAASADWGDRLDPHVIDALQKKRLLPVSDLDRGFVRPSYPQQVGVSYFQAGRICDFINEKLGYGKLLEMMHSFGAGRSTPEVIEKHTGMKPLEFDAKFLAWLDGKVASVVSSFPEWKRRMRELSEAAKAGKHDDVLREGPTVRDLYPDYVEQGSAYELIAAAHLAKGDKTAARAELERYASAGGRDPETLKKLASFYAEAGRRKEAARTLERLLYVYPMEEDVHRRMGDLWMAENDGARALAAYELAVAAKPLDPAVARFNLARALRAQNRIEDAREQLLLALEAAPGYRPAQKMLLELSQ